MMLPLLPHNYPWLHISPIFFFLSLSLLATGHVNTCIPVYTQYIRSNIDRLYIHICMWWRSWWSECLSDVGKRERGGPLASASRGGPRRQCRNVLTQEFPPHAFYSSAHTKKVPPTLTSWLFSFRFSLSVLLFC